jgi:hypothetical protein
MPCISTRAPAEHGGSAFRPSGGSRLLRRLALATPIATVALVGVGGYTRSSVHNVRPEVSPSSATTVEPTLNTAPRG